MEIAGMMLLGIVACIWAAWGPKVLLAVIVVVPLLGLMAIDQNDKSNARSSRRAMKFCPLLRSPQSSGEHFS